MNSKAKTSTIIATLLILAAIIYRVLPHPPNFAPITGVALFGGAVFSRKWLALLIPFVALYMGDLIINNTIARSFFADVQGFVWFSPYMIFNFLAFGLIVFVGYVGIKKLSFARVIGGALGASLLFFIITNFGSWLTSGFYPRTLTGLIECFVAAIPFFQSTLLGDMVFTFIMFGSYMIAMNYTTQKMAIKHAS